MSDDTGSPRPLFSVVKGGPTEAETAALAVVLDEVAAARAHRERPRPNPRGLWGTPRERLQAPRDFNPAGYRVANPRFGER